MPGRVYESKVKDIMSRDVVYVHPQESVREALALMVDNHVSALPVVEGHGRCAGIISTSDLVSLNRQIDEDLEDIGRTPPESRSWFMDRLNEGLGNQRVMEVMSEDVTSIGPDVPVVEAAEAMLKHRVHRLPVLDEERKLVGIVSTMDLLRTFVEKAPK